MTREKGKKDKRALVCRGIFLSDRVREPTHCFDAEYHKMDELIDLIDGISHKAQADRSRCAGTQLKPSYSQERVRYRTRGTDSRLQIEL